MIRTEILIRAGRQHLSRSILARAVARTIDESTTFPIALNGSSAIQLRDPSHFLPPVSVAAAEQRYHSRTRSHAPGWFFGDEHGTYTHPFSQAQANLHAEERKPRSSERPARDNERPFARHEKTRKRKENDARSVNVIVRQHSPHTLTR